MSAAWPVGLEGSIWGSTSGISKIWHSSLKSITLWRARNNINDQFQILTCRETIKDMSKIVLFWISFYTCKNNKKNKYLFFADVLVGLIFKPLLNASKRHVPVIFGNILTETEGRERGRKWGGGQRQEKWLFDPLCLLHPYNQLLGTNLVTCPFENYSFSMRCSPIKMTHPEARFCDSVGDSPMVTQSPHHPPIPYSPNASFSLFWLSLGFMFALNTQMVVSWSPDIINNLISNQCGYPSMLKTDTSPINCCYLFVEQSEAVGPSVSQGTLTNQKTEKDLFLFTFPLLEYRQWKAVPSINGWINSTNHQQVSGYLFLFKTVLPEWLT